jgi:hypothetical protein
MPVIERAKARTVFASIVINCGMAAIRTNPEFTQVRP